jgi:glyoxylase-like metal-dependent hydrolase (beta-lactamase superfamily II)
MLKIEDAGPVTIFRMGRSFGGFTLYSVSAYLLSDILIDSGTVHTCREFLAAVNDKEVRTLVNTHHHEDHIGNNKLIQDELGSTLMAHPAALPYLENPEKLGLKFYQRFVWGLPPSSTGKPVTANISSAEYELKVIPTPGHTTDHICLFEEKQGWLFSGDIYCGRRFKYLRKDENYSEILESLKLLSRLDFDTIFCSLKGQVKDGKSALTQKIAFMDELKAKAIDLLRKGLSPKKTRLLLLGREDTMAFITRGHYSKQNTVDSILLEAAK